MHQVPVDKFFVGKDHPLTIISGPCVIESEEHCLRSAEVLVEITSRFNINFIFKSSYDKANRSSIHSFRGPGLQEGLRILAKVKETFNIPVLTDVHTPQDAILASQVCDVLQIPAFLCRQTDLVVAAAQTGRVINIKKGQFMAPWDMKNVVEKARSAGNANIILTDRGTSFGYNNLVSDMRGIPIMQQLGVPVCFDATHSVQLPGGLGDSSGGQREFVAILAKAAVAVGADAIFMESHPHPELAKSDASSVISFSELPSILGILERLYTVVRQP